MRTTMCFQDLGQEAAAAPADIDDPFVYGEVIRARDSGVFGVSSIRHPLSRASAPEEKATGRGAPQPRTRMAPEAIKEAVIRFIEDDSLMGQVVEVRPTGVNVIEPRRAPERRA